MRYQLTPIFCRPWTLNGLSMQLIESHYENNYGGALLRLNAMAEKLESLDFADTPPYIVNSLKREELIALNSTLLHELYFASLAFGDGRPTEMLARALTSDFGSVDRWRDEFVAMANGLAGRSGWVLLVYVPRDRRLIKSSLICRESRWKMSRRCWTRASRSNSSMRVRSTTYPVRRTSSKAPSGATRSAWRNGRVNSRNQIR